MTNIFQYKSYRYPSVHSEKQVNPEHISQLKDFQGIMIHAIRGWCTGVTQRDGVGRKVGEGFRMGNTCTPMVDPCQCMSKPIKYCKVKKKKKKDNVT